MTAAALTLAALIAVLVSLAGPAERAPAAFAGKNGRIAIVSDRDHNLGVVGDQIFTMNQHGGKLHQLTCCVPTSGPTFSPSGKRILFSEFDGVQNDVFVMHSDGTSQKKLTENPAKDTSASFSPDGERIVFVSDRTGHSQIFLMDADGSHQHRITDDSLENDDPVFFPSGKKIVVDAAKGDNEDIFSMDLDGTHRRQLTHSPTADYYPDVSPNGRKIVFDRNRRNGDPDLLVMRSNGRHLKRLTDTKSAGEFDPTFSPDGRKIAFDKNTSTTETSNYDLFVMSASGKHKHLLLGGPSTDYPSDWARRP